MQGGMGGAMQQPMNMGNFGGGMPLGAGMAMKPM
jgi:hypothetical protein